jgi:uncharacterized glyoxalase superfamily protein PhnB
MHFTFKKTSASFVYHFYFYKRKNLKMEATEVIPILRIFDVAKAKAFYIDWLEFALDWEHTFNENAPVYMQISKGNAILHLSEHYGDGTPGTGIFIWCTGLEAFQKMLLDKNYKYYRPGLETTFYNSLCMNVIDPFGNKISFNEKLNGTAG